MCPDVAPVDIVVIGGVNTDYTVHASTLPDPDNPVSDGEFVHGCGGKGLNQAVAAARLGGRVALIGAVGDDERGEAAIDCLKREHVDPRLAVKRGTPTGATVIHVDSRGRKQTAAALGANLLLTAADVDLSAGVIAGARVVLVQFEVPVDAVAHTMALASTHGVPVLVDPAPARPLPESITRHAYVLKPNAIEARALTGTKVQDRESAGIAARMLSARGPRHVVLSTSSGTLWTSPDDERWYPNLPVHTVDTTGAGDAFAGALAVALVERQSMTDAVPFAHAAAAIATTRVGAFASLPTRAEVDRLLRSVYA